jgi:hypothetical protein
MTLTKLPIDGLKVSTALAQINLQASSSSMVLEAFHRLAAQRINMSLVTLDATDGHWAASCCILLENLARTRQELHGLLDKVDFIEPVGTLTVFPHRSRLDLLRKILAIFKETGLPVYGIATATSTLTVITEFERLAQAVAAIQQIADLRANHAPFQTQMQVKQI